MRACEACIQYNPDMTQATPPNGVCMGKRDQQQAASDCTLDDLMDEAMIVVAPLHITQQLLQLWEEAEPFGTLILKSHDEPT
jgi:hypothetical protein